MTDELSNLLRQQSTELLDGNVSGIAEELGTAEDGKLSVSIGFRLCLIGRKIVCDTTVSYSRKFKDETDGVAELSDPNQPELEIEAPSRKGG